MARMARRLTPIVTIYTDGADELAQQIIGAAKDDDIRVESKSIKLLEKGAEATSVVVHLKDGSSITEGFLVSQSPYFSFPTQISSPKFQINEKDGYANTTPH